MIGQAEFRFDAPATAAIGVAVRRIDITIDRLHIEFDAMSEDDRLTLTRKPWWHAVDTVLALRAMERGEEEALGRPRGTTADIYDRLVSPGEHILEALIRVHNDFMRLIAVSTRPSPSPSTSE